MGWVELSTPLKGLCPKCAILLSYFACIGLSRQKLLNVILQKAYLYVKHQIMSSKRDVYLPQQERDGTRTGRRDRQG